MAAQLYSKGARPIYKGTFTNKPLEKGETIKHTIYSNRFQV
jgi:hypothetical protein